MNTKTWKNRALSVALTVIMVISMLPLPVFAAEGGTVANALTVMNSGTAEGNVAEVTIDSGTTSYTDIDAAFAAAQEADSATVKLLNDVTINHAGDTYGIKLGKGSITLDLNGKTLSQKGEIANNKFYPLSAVFYMMSCRLTIQDSTAEKRAESCSQTVDRRLLLVMAAR